MNCFCGMVDRQKVFSLISSRDHCQRSSPSRISDTPQAGFEPAQSLSSGLVEWSCAVVITTAPRRHCKARLWSSSIVIWVTQVFGDLHSGPWNVLINFLNFRRKVKPLTSSGRKFQILGSSVLRLFSPNVVVLTLLTTQWLFLLAKCGLSQTKCVLSLDLRILKSSLLISANGTLPW